MNSGPRISSPALTPGAFKREVRRWARRIGVEPREIRLRDMTRKLASATSEGRITFDRSLVTAKADQRTNVIVHELVHLKVGNHGALFRSLVRAHLGAAPRPEPAEPR